MLERFHRECYHTRGIILLAALLITFSTPVFRAYMPLLVNVVSAAASVAALLWALWSAVPPR